MSGSKTTQVETLERVTITLPTTLAEQIKDFWHSRRLGSNSEAIRKLVEAGLKAEKSRPHK